MGRHDSSARGAEVRGDASAVPISICAWIERARPGAAERSPAASNAHARVVTRGAHARVPPRERRTMAAAEPGPTTAPKGDDDACPPPPPLRRLGRPRRRRQRRAWGVRQARVGDTEARVGLALWVGEPPPGGRETVRRGCVEGAPRRELLAPRSLS